MPFPGGLWWLLCCRRGFTLLRRDYGEAEREADGEAEEEEEASFELRTQGDQGSLEVSLSQPTRSSSGSERSLLVAEEMRSLIVEKGPGPVEDDPDALVKGWLQREMRGCMKTPWIRPRKYWFVLTPDSLDYYSSNEKGARRLGSLVLTSLCSVLWPDKQLYKETGYWSVTVFGRKHCYRLYTEHLNEAVRWVCAVQKVIDSKAPVQTPTQLLMRDVEQLESERDPVPLMQGVLQTCLDLPPLVDEIYCQLVKQTTEPPAPGGQGDLHYWQLLTCMSCTFLPSPPVLRFLRFHLDKTESRFPASEMAKYACFIREALGKTKGRECVPSLEEILMLMQRQEMICTVHCPGAPACSVAISSHTTAQEVAQELVSRLGLSQSPNLFALYEQSRRREQPVGSATLLADVLTSLAGEQREQDPPCRLCFKHYGFLDTDNVPRDSLEFALLFEQCRGARLRVGLLAGGLWGQALAKQRAERDQRLRGRLREEGASTMAAIVEKWKLLQGMGRPEAMAAYVALVREWPGFGSTLFDVDLHVSPVGAGPQRLWLGIGAKAVSLYKPGEPEPLDSFCYGRISSFGASDSSTFRLSVEDRDLLFETSQVDEIAQLLNTYLASAGAQRLPRPQESPTSSPTSESTVLPQGLCPAAGPWQHRPPVGSSHS
ncbi:pleckstrin like proteiny, MyTH4 and FERM domain containing H3 [Pitangus sulphuratus]|nr:pleckstrin like proteiny, MyTH4 and FERM domain containing H3 [Pitangus sulphuratus]